MLSEEVINRLSAAARPNGLGHCRCYKDAVKVFRKLDVRSRTQLAHLKL